MPPRVRQAGDPIHPGPGPTHVDSFVSEWLDHLHHLDDVSISRQFTRSAPEMGYTRDADGFAVPPTPASTRASSFRATEGSASNTASVRHPSYRRNNLTSNGSYVRHADTQLPDYISSHVEELRAERDSPGPSSQQIDGYIHGLEILAEGCNEADVDGLLEDAIFPIPLDLTYGRSAGLESAKSSLISSHLIPNNPESQFGFWAET
ncbi:hypothetical protein BR93DRAFT_987812 [Coniochaeta sp. PMI_546]|nr:hypothetical protein BR93DRAFT_987812 [Coniochaeta sp. PMI_546]